MEVIYLVTIPLTVRNLINERRLNSIGPEVAGGVVVVAIVSVSGVLGLGGFLGLVLRGILSFIDCVSLWRDDGGVVGATVGLWLFGRRHGSMGRWR